MAALADYAALHQQLLVAFRSQAKARWCRNAPWRHAAGMLRQRLDTRRLVSPCLQRFAEARRLDHIDTRVSM